MATDRWAASFYPHEPPLRVEHGIATARQNGQMAQTWWSARLVGAMEQAGTPARMKHGRRYARSGQLISLDVSTGLLTARVQGSDPTPYLVEIRSPAVPAETLARIDEALRSRVGYAAQLLAGDLPRELAGGPDALLPRTWDELDARCSCPDDESPCKHLAAVVYIFAERIDSDPWLLLEWLGCPRETVLGGTEGPGSLLPPWWPLRPGLALPAPVAPAALGAASGPRSALERLSLGDEALEAALADVYGRIDVGG
jgi:SWIM zinc finger